MKPVCIGLPVYNGEQFIADAVESILQQSYAAFDLIILDNASTDATQDICRRYVASDPRVHYQRNPSNIGAPANFNKVLSLSGSKYFKWAAADDMLAVEYLQRCVEVLESREDVVLCHSEAKIIDSSGIEVKNYNNPLSHEDSHRAAERFSDLMLAKHACFDVFGLMRRSVLLRTPGIGNFKSADRNLLAELALAGRIHRVGEPLFLSREHEGRSVRITAPQELRNWWGQTGILVFPYWRNLAEYFDAVTRSSVPLAEKMSCYAAVARWGSHHWRHLGSDVRLAIYRILGLRAS